MRSISVALALLLTAALTLCQAAGPSIGWITARGSFELDRVRIAGNATLFEGSQIETKAANAQLTLRGGARLELAPGSACRVYSDRVALDHGQGQLARGGAFEVETLGLRIQPERAGALARIAVRENRSVHVTALGGPVRVVRPGVATVAQVLPGKAVLLKPEAANPGVTTLTGIVRKVNGKYLLTDTTANITVELVGQNLKKYVGKQVQVTGNIQPGTQALQIATITVSAAAAGAAAGAAGGTAAATGMAAGAAGGTATATIAGVGVMAATAGTAYVTNNDPTPSISR